MIGRADPGNADSYVFTPVTGVLKVTLINVPSDACQLVLTSASDNLTGSFPMDTEAGLRMSDASNVGHSITVHFPRRVAGSTVTLYMPVPVGSISAGAVFSVCRSDDSEIKAVTTTSAISVTRGHLTPLAAIEVEPAFEEVTVYYENLDGNTSYTGYMTSSGWENASGAGAGSVTYNSWNARIRKDNYGSAGNIGTYDGASGNCYARFTYYNSEYGYLTISNISTCGYANFRLGFGAAQGPDVLKVEVSPDGSDWTQLDYTFSESYNHWGYAATTFSVRSRVDKIYIKFTLLDSQVQYGANIDDVKLEAIGTPSATLVGEDEPEPVPTRYAELPATVSNADYYYNTLFTTTVSSGKHVRNYSFCYDIRRHNPIWVAFPMHAIYAEGYGRSKTDDNKDPWMKYPDLPVESQSIIWDITETGYYQYWSRTTLESGSWTKGHLCMSSSRAGAGKEINLQTFYPVNIAPQSNAGAGIFADLWEDTEDFHFQHGTQICSDTLYVVAGCHYANDNAVEYDACDYNDPCGYSKPCIMPTHQYKLFLRTRNGDTGKAIQNCTADELKCIGFWLDAVIPAGSSSSLADYALSVSEIESRTGLTFFPSVPDAVKSQCVPSDWGL